MKSDSLISQRNGTFQVLPHFTLPTIARSLMHEILSIVATTQVPGISLRSLHYH